MLKSYKKQILRKEHDYVSVDEFTHFSDEEIIQRIRKGSKPLFEVIIRRYNQRLFRIQRSYIQDENAIKDTLQITYMKVYENLGKFRGDSLFSTWITRIAINEALKYLKKERRYSEMKVVKEADEKYQTNMDHNETPETVTVGKDLIKLLENTVQRLDMKYRSVYLMREVEQMSVKETADCLQISESNVKARLHRARQMMRNDLERRVTNTDIFNFQGSQCDEVVYRVMTSI